jgi:hypothetical protein
VFTGSSNLASGGEESNGDNLIEIQDPTIAGLFAVQAMGLVDHFHFRTAMQSATKAQPLKLSTDDWVAPYYDSQTENFRERALLVGAKAAGAHA